MIYVVIGGVVLLVLLVLQRKAVGRVFTAGGAQFAKAARAVWRADPVAVYQAEVDRSADDIRDATTGLEQYRGLVARLQRQVANGEREEARLTARVKSALTLGDEPKAGEYAVQLKKTQSELAENRAQLQGYDVAYQNSLKKIKYARQRIDQARDKAQKLDADLRLSRAEAETAKLAANFNVRSNTLDGLGEVEDEIQRQIDTNRGKAQVIQDLSSEGLEEIAAEEAQQKQEAKEVLDKMKADMGLGKKS